MKKIVVEEKIISVEPDYIFCNVNRTNHKIILNEILYVESLKDYVRIITKNNKLVVKGNIGSFMKKLPFDRFIRVHRSFIVALYHVESYNQIELDVSGHKIPVGISYKDEVIEKFS